MMCNPKTLIKIALGMGALLLVGYLVFPTSHAWIGAAAPYLQLPPISRSRLCIDIGCPGQVASAPGWERLDLDSLLSGQRQKLDDEQRSRLTALAKNATDDLKAALADGARPGRLSSLEETRRKYFTEALPSLLEDLPRPQAEKLRQSIAQFAHQMLRAAGAARK